MDRPFLLAQVSDLHIKAAGRLSYKVVDTAGMLRACIDHLRALPQRPDAVAFTGDLTDFGRADEYAVLRGLLEPLDMPVFLVPGNHDERDALRTAFPDHAYLRQSPEFIQYVIEQFPLRIVGLDTVVPGRPGGLLCEARLDWLEATLAARPDVPTVILMHHPPFHTYIGHMDAQGLAGAEALERIVRRYPCIERLLCGHLHRGIHARFGGTIASTVPGPAHQVVLDLEPEAASRFVMEPPAYALHAYTPATGVVSHVAYVGRFDGPYPFYDTQGRLID